MIIRISRIKIIQRAYGMWSWDVTKRMMAYRWISFGDSDDDADDDDDDDDDCADVDIVMIMIMI